MQCAQPGAVVNIGVIVCIVPMVPLYYCYPSFTYGQVEIQDSPVTSQGHALAHKGAGVRCGRPGPKVCSLCVPCRRVELKDKAFFPLWGDQG